jgi:general secretion pathway protein D
MPATEAQQAPRAPQTPGVPQAPQAPQSPEQPARLALPSVELAELLRQVAARSGKDFVVDARVPPRIYVRGTSLDNPSYPVLLAILRADGFAAVEIQGRVHIVPDGEVRQMAVPLAQNDDASIPDEECVTRILTVTTRNPAGLVPVLRPLMPQWAHLAAVVNEPEQGRTTGGKLLITDSYANVKRITALVRELTQ